MEKIPVQKIARALYVLVMIALVCNVIALYLVPMAVEVGSETLLEEGHLISAYLLGSWKAWVLVGWWRVFDAYQMVLTLFLLFSGCCTAVILWQARRVLNTILRGGPFSPENAVSLNRAALCCFLVAGAALARVIFSVYYYRSPLPLASYNALFVPMFAMGGLLCLVMSALFRQAAELKAENDLTI